MDKKLADSINETIAVALGAQWVTMLHVAKGTQTPKRALLLNPAPTNTVTADMARPVVRSRGDHPDYTHHRAALNEALVTLAPKIDKGQLLQAIVDEVGSALPDDTVELGWAVLVAPTEIVAKALADQLAL